ncbi:MAG: ABC transporter ATP-binding protein [Candidatus Eisenbacteria bacterium]|uniref:ABC transporter ATP-binding protein n=1 Tax=Eiseniibacteriota bacterium TaxID=2212470 RepID=A0A948W7H5_UNCEI|nr:ABC transporter ATP-binding protein [Candidatus Eisenbacteria bacterium]MBU1948352.1 ABC transporter ATP-binding protein [Candidatus Eisenbacteria bacterium]MBU2692245.1 ABC transporter ATP-binding protein [Candidatus Eisenbacteria bacterium]
MSAPWIELNNVQLSRGGRPVLQGITASLSGRAIGLVGVNGSGKSTLIGALLGVLRAHTGSIKILGRSIPEEAMEVRARAGVMAEQAGIFPGGSGVDAVTFAGTLSGLPRRESLRRAHRALDALDVGEDRYRPTKGYSTGMRQRCKLAMSLVHGPEILILDEPTVGLDPKGRMQLLSLIRDLRDEGRKILLSTHILQDAEFLCDDLLLLEAGTISYFGPVANLTKAGTRQYVAEGTGFVDDFIQSLKGAGMEILHFTNNRLSFLARNDDDLRLFWQAAAERNVEIRQLSREIATLEDAVVDVMEQNMVRNNV